MQHMVGAKLDCVLGPDKFEHSSYSTSDQQSARSGDFFLGDVAIHVTTSPGEAVIERSRDNLNDGFRPILVTGQRGLTVAEGLADSAGVAGRIDVLEVEQFIALNLYELRKFGADGPWIAVFDFVTRYNEIIDDVETDPSLKIEFKHKPIGLRSWPASPSPPSGSRPALRGPRTSGTRRRWLRIAAHPSPRRVVARPFAPEAIRGRRPKVSAGSQDRQDRRLHARGACEFSPCR